MDAERSAAYPTPDEELVAVAEEVRDQLVLKGRYRQNFKISGTHFGVILAITARQEQQNEREEHHGK